MWCGSQLQAKEIKHDAYPWTYDISQHCTFCGWTQRRINYVDENRYPSGDVYCWRNELRDFEINSPQLREAEVAIHLQKRPEDLYYLHPRRFEEIVAATYEEHGYRTILTKPTRDDGVDIFLMEDDVGILALVEVKRFAKQRKVGIGHVDRLRGAQLRKGVNHAIIVTTSSFSSYALKGAKAEKPIASGFTMDLIDAEELLRMLGVFRQELPPMEEIVQHWRLSGKIPPNPACR
jgi:Holliday junction resolvase-like predicted endonuclease